MRFAAARHFPAGATTSSFPETWVTFGRAGEAPRSIEAGRNRKKRIDVMGEMLARLPIVHKPRRLWHNIARMRTLLIVGLVCFWCQRQRDWAYGECILVTPPTCGIADYHPGESRPPRQTRAFRAAASTADARRVLYGP